jgi:hypothetical protein
MNKPFAFALGLIAVGALYIIGTATEPVAAPPAELTTPAQREAATKLIIAYGFNCAYVKDMVPYVFAGYPGFTAWCHGTNGQGYRYELADKGKGWTVHTPD